MRRGLAYAGVQKGTAAAASHVSAAPPAGAAQHCTVAVEAACQPAGSSCLGLASCREEALPHKVLAREASGLSDPLLMLLSMRNGLTSDVLFKVIAGGLGRARPAAQHCRHQLRTSAGHLCTGRGSAHGMDVSSPAAKRGNRATTCSRSGLSCILANCLPHTHPSYNLHIGALAAPPLQQPPPLQEQLLQVWQLQRRRLPAAAAAPAAAARQGGRAERRSQHGAQPRHLRQRQSRW